MIIYAVSNKTSSAFFESEKDADRYLGECGTAANGLSITEIYVFDDSTKNNKALHADTKYRCGQCGKATAYNIGICDDCAD